MRLSLSLHFENFNFWRKMQKFLCFGNFIWKLSSLKFRLCNCWLWSSKEPESNQDRPAVWWTRCAIRKICVDLCGIVWPKIVWLSIFKIKFFKWLICLKNSSIRLSIDSGSTRDRFGYQMHPPRTWWDSHLIAVNIYEPFLDDLVECFCMVDTFDCVPILVGFFSSFSLSRFFSCTSSRPASLPDWWCRQWICNNVSVYVCGIISCVYDFWHLNLRDKNSWLQCNTKYCMLCLKSLEIVWIHLKRPFEPSSSRFNAYPKNSRSLSFSLWMPINCVWIN